jgi:hypothetical protein
VFLDFVVAQCGVRDDRFSAFQRPQASLILLFVFVFSFLVELGFEFRDSQLQNRHCTYRLSHTSSPFCSVLFWRGEFWELFAQAGLGRPSS